MAWDVMLFNFGGALTPDLSTLAESDLRPLGSAEDVCKRISDLLPGVDWKNPADGHYYGDGFSIHFNVGDQDPVNNMMLEVRGGGDAIAAIMQFAPALGWAVLDCSSGECLDPAHPSQDSWEAYQKLVDGFLRSKQTDALGTE